jgi:AIPR protein
MSKIHVNQINKKIKDLFAEHIDMADQKAGSGTYDDVFCSRGLAAYAIHHLSGCSSEDAAGSVTDGGNDNGIDAIYYDISQNKIYVAQSKWIKDGNGEPENGSVKKFVAGTRDLLDLSFDRFNAKINLKKNLITAAIETAGNSIILILAHTGKNELSEHSRRDFKDLLEEVNDVNDELLAVQVLNQSLLHRSLTENLNDPISTQLVLRYWGKVQEPKKAIYGQISAGDLGKLWKSYGERLVAKNLRGALGDTDVNKEIGKTLRDNAAHFWYFNNGITAIASKLDKTLMGGGTNDLGVFDCDNIQVVNGAQTLSTIGKHYGKYGDKGLENCFVQIRIVSLEDADKIFGSQVTRTNNRQNRIEARDFLAQDPNQIRIKTELAIDGVNYQITRSHEFVRTQSSFDLVDATTAIVCSLAQPSLVATLKSQPQRLWEDSSKAPYTSLFNGGLAGFYLWRLVKTQRMLDSLLDSVAKKQRFPRHRKTVIYGNRLIASLVFSQLPTDNYKEINSEFSEKLVEEKVSDLLEEFSTLVVGYVQKWHYTKHIPPLFRNQDHCSVMFEKILRERAANSRQS